MKGRDYSPPRREKVLEFQAHQFPESVYSHISEYREQKAHVHALHEEAGG